MTSKLLAIAAAMIAAAVLGPQTATAAALPAGAVHQSQAMQSGLVQEAKHRHRHRHSHNHHFRHHHFHHRSNRCWRWRNICGDRWGWGTSQQRRCMRHNGC